ncbi:glycogen/starch/alpha-glucan phosphorylase [Salinarimonas rosea]|uniref:glycogen/starch/alpha-glucan phosphorylase n=1 Tax=Salinarimonas rosea TaxID=552063 RepID=UPI0009FF7C2C|nr:glycogen/starch/alpha-glucan phosphorylase [Salinarimonas rosea]
MSVVDQNLKRSPTRKPDGATGVEAAVEVANASHAETDSRAEADSQPAAKPARKSRKAATGSASAAATAAAKAAAGPAPAPVGLGPLPSGAPAIEEIADPAVFREAILRKLLYSVGKDASRASEHDWLVATILALRDGIVDRWIDSTRRTYASGKKRVYYLSLEFLIGRMLFDALGNLGLTETAREALAPLGVDLDRLRQAEPDAALGNGGLGRLAACFIESLSSLKLPAYGYGIRYDYGLFKQAVSDGWQREIPEDWLSFGNPWEFERPEVAYEIGFGGHVSDHPGPDGSVHRVWQPGEKVLAAAYDTPVVGWRGAHVNTLRLWSAKAPQPIALEAFNVGDYVGAMAQRARIEAISRVLYPSDATPAGYELRLRQEYFFTAASLQDLIRRHLQAFGTLENLGEKAAIQLNDTHPAIAVAELMRLLIDVHGFAYDDAWRLTRQTLNYTNHTLLPEALETWSVQLMERLLPRHMEIIYRINWHHLEEVSRGSTQDQDLIRSVSLIDESHGRRVRMGHLAFLGSNKVNGVSALHTELMRETVFADLHALFPDRIVSKTNGVTFRRWLQQCNPALTKLLVETLGERVLDDPAVLRGLEAHADDPAFQARYSAVKHANKEALAVIIAQRTGWHVDPTAMFDVQIKRIHEYKRQLLNVLETVALYHAIKAHPDRPWPKRVKIFAGKAAASYTQAKLIIKLAHDVARVINTDPQVGDRLKLVFLPNYNVSLAEAIIPAADLSEQISTAGMEASGTGNMKLALNGALTIGTLDGANVEIREHVGEENIVIFGLTAEEVGAKRKAGLSPDQRSARLARVLYEIETGVFSPEDPTRFDPIVEALDRNDHFLVGPDFDAYWEAQREVDGLWADQPTWWRMAILNTARIGWFSSDRTISEYASEIWGAQPL